MELGIKEAAALLGVHPRTLRERLVHGKLNGTKRGGRWRIQQADLPLSEGQRRALRQRASEAREALEEGLTHVPGHRRRRSVRDLEPFERLVGLLQQIDGQVDDRCLAADLEAGLLLLAEGAHAFDRDSKLLALRNARARLAQACGRLALQPGRMLGALTGSGLLQSIEQEVLPALGGLLRWAERLQTEGRQEWNSRQAL
jgi:excisionase family DNA binding protein